MRADPSPPLPAARGPLTEALLAAWRGSPPATAGPLPGAPPWAAADGDPDRDPGTDEDLQLALYCCNELHYRGFAGVDERWERHPASQ